MVLQNFGSWWKGLASQLGKRQAKEERPLKRSHLQVKSDLYALAQVLQWLEDEIYSLLPRDRWWQYQTALAEGFTNAVRHAHHDLPPTTEIEIEVTVFPSYVEIKIWDYGPPFDLEAKLQSRYENPNGNPLDEGGRGLIFMHQLTNELLYVRIGDNRNCLIMRKNFR